MNASEFTLNVGHYTRASRAQMLFNHMYFSDISIQERNALLESDFFLKIIDHRNFNPRLIDLLTAADYVSITGVPIREAVTAILENPHELWEKPYRHHISDEARALMLALFFNEVSPTIPGSKSTRNTSRKTPPMPVVHKTETALPTTANEVWVNTRSGKYWKPGSRFYGKTKEGEFMSELEALDRGYSPAGGTRPIDYAKNQKLTKVIAGRTVKVATVEPGAVLVLFDDQSNMKIKTAGPATVE